MRRSPVGDLSWQRVGVVGIVGKVRGPHELEVFVADGVGDQRRDFDVDSATRLRPKGTKGFVVLPRRWKVERSIGWIMNARSSCRDYERLPQYAEAHLNWAFITPMTRRLARKGLRTDRWERKPQ